MILVVDNYDSFTFNLVQLLGRLGAEPVVRRNDALSASDALALEPAAIVLSPGPGRPTDAGISLELVRRARNRIPLLGICLGHQCLAEAWGGRTVHARSPMHGKTSQVHHDGTNLFSGLPSPLTVARYHSLQVDEASLPSELRAHAKAEDGTIMGVVDEAGRQVGLQFHPESFLTPEGEAMLSNFLQWGDVRCPTSPTV
ncbi:MAG: anthranilate synthase component II [Planctomycetota bacterium JB042]